MTITPPLGTMPLLSFVFTTVGIFQCSVGWVPSHALTGHQFHFLACAWVVGSIPRWGHAEGQPMHVSLSPPTQINKNIFKKCSWSIHTVIRSIRTNYTKDCNFTKGTSLFMKTYNSEFTSEKINVREVYLTWSDHFCVTKATTDKGKR